MLGLGSLDLDASLREGLSEYFREWPQLTQGPTKAKFSEKSENKEICVTISYDRKTKVLELNIMRSIDGQTYGLKNYIFFEK